MIEKSMQLAKVYIEQLKELHKAERIIMQALYDIHPNLETMKIEGKTFLEHIKAENNPSEDFILTLFGRFVLEDEQ